MSHTPEPLLVTVADSCKMIGICRSNLEKMFKDGRIRSVKIGRKVMVPVSSIKDFVDSLPQKAA